jgi:hypothetical protein
MKRNLTILISAYWISIVVGNLLVSWLGPPGIIITSFIFIPFDFVIRCIIHERLKRYQLYFALLFLIGTGALMTYALNRHAEAIAKASVIAFSLAGLTGSLVYQLLIHKRGMIKINVSDASALIVDSIIFQTVAFDKISISIISLQIIVKVLGGLLWYYILFARLRLMEKIRLQDVDSQSTLLKVVLDSQGPSELIENQDIC